MLFSPQKLRGRTGCVYINWIYFLPLKNIDSGDHILQCDGIPGPVSAARQPTTDVVRHKVKNDIHIPGLYHTSFRRHFFDGV